MPGLKLITAPTIEPITAAQLLDRVGMDAADFEAGVIDASIKSARGWVENHLGRALLEQTWELALDAFTDEIELPKPPAASITSIKYIDADGAEQTLASSEYVLDNYAVPAFIHTAYDKAWPTTRAQVNAVKVRFVCGYATVDELPADIVQAVVLICGMTLRGQPGQEAGLYPASVPKAAEQLLQPYRVMGF